MIKIQTHSKDVKYEINGNELSLYVAGEKYEPTSIVYDTGLSIDMPAGVSAVLMPSDHVFDNTTLYVQAQKISNGHIKVKAKSLVTPGRKAYLNDPIAKVVFMSSAPVEITDGKKTEGKK